MNRRMRPQEAITGINVTPLVDVCLVLVIIFMVLAPLTMQAGIEVSSSNSNAVKATYAARDVVAIILEDDGRLKIDSKTISWDMLSSTLTTALARNVPKAVSISASPQASVEQVVEIMDVSKQAGAKKLALINPS